MVKFFGRKQKRKYVPSEPLEKWLRLISRVSLYSLISFFVIAIMGAAFFTLYLKTQNMPAPLTDLLVGLMMLFLMTLIPAILWFWQGRRYSRNKLTESLFGNEEK